MQERPFLDKSVQPTEPMLKAALGKSFGCYQELLALANAYSQEWTFYRSFGWMLKVHARRKALFYMIPLHSGLKVSLTLRTDERDTFLDDGELATFGEQLQSAKRYPEGWAMQFEIDDKQECQRLGLFVSKLMALRGQGRRQILDST